MEEYGRIEAYSYGMVRRIVVCRFGDTCESGYSLQSGGLRFDRKDESF
jgi:hypothetical protein